MTKKTELQVKFEEYDRKNPRVYALFKKYTKDAIRRGHQKLSGWFIVNIIRWEEGVDVKTGEEFKISNDFIALYTRKFVEEHPKHREFFTLKQMKRA